ncbi:hypothetical protein G3T14_10145 [Methylobacterium sp. BTF04]|nr:hypothetical protein [Methylobacterium sp. BTF04]NEU12495.1 hypothetical protein [Methylobacterium sp. BTF04]
MAHILVIGASNGIGLNSIINAFGIADPEEARTVLGIGSDDKVDHLGVGF